MEVPESAFREILEAYCSDLGTLCRDLQQAATARQPDRFRQAAHALAGASASIGAVQLEGLARRALQPDGLVEMGELARRIETCTVDTLAALQTLADHPPPREDGR
ncbi:Hpt domain-containing protein [Teichococcus vastitatis]|jgi:HPt (histidine-containing phosphotransfer) domain-containing protein|uniref:Hpt domain-containing protein n=1 Tax=Teichococcus vastitatis TaxID=2307076 RepID=A0ABS9VZV9_9PROT|nr:Hpt domain-containing protein [Pseudoroseomonas vastitatis]MCI0752462.1 Hpt domain-containing protein [Pseudoroseomonas vastitatis]